jgi:shikimate kinase
MNIFLVGFMGSGKSFLGRQLACQLNYTFIETDEWIEHAEGKSISKIFEEEGEPYFRKKETEFLLGLKMVNFCVIATGGGMPCYADNMNLMNTLGTTIWLEVDENILLERLKAEKEHRPMLVKAYDLQKRIRDLLETRKPYYQRANKIIQNPNIDHLLAFTKNLKISQS